MTDDMKKILMAMPEKRASDVHIGAKSPIHYRIDNELVPVDDKVLTAEDTEKIVFELMSEVQKKKFVEDREMDFSFEIENIGRFRANAFYQRHSVGCAIRLIPFKLMTIEECGLPVEVVRSFSKLRRGLVLITGATGSGKSTTLSSMVNDINQSRSCHIVTVEDPIEFIHENSKSIVDQRQILEDTHSFSSALRHVLRQDPDVILIGELRDIDTIQEALVIADTGHLVLGTLHTSDSIQTINRIVDVFPSHQQRQIRVQLSFVLAGILSQQLIPLKGKSGMALATEVLVATPAVRSMIREAKEHQIYSIIQTSQKYGMRTMNQGLSELYLDGQIAYEDAISRSSNVEELVKMMG